MPSKHLILCHPLLLLPSIFPSIRVFSIESALRTRWPKYWSFRFNIGPSNEHPGLISFRMDWLDQCKYYSATKMEQTVDTSTDINKSPKRYAKWNYLDTKYYCIIIFVWFYWNVKVKVFQPCPDLCDPLNCSLRGSCVHGILQARMLEWAAIPFSRQSSYPRNQPRVPWIAGRFFTNWAPFCILVPCDEKYIFSWC